MKDIKVISRTISISAGVVLLALWFINSHFYNNVMDTGYFTVPLAVIALLSHKTLINEEEKLNKIGAVAYAAIIITAAVLFIIFKPNYTADEAYKIINENPEIMSVEIGRRNHSLINTEINLLIPQGYLFFGETAEKYIYVHFNPVTGDYKIGNCWIRERESLYVY